MKIKASPEGRENIFIPDKESLKEFIKWKKLKRIHNFVQGGPCMIGADHDVESVLEDIDKAERLGLFTDDSNMGHALALIGNNKLEAYDIGKIKVSDIELESAKIIVKTRPGGKG